jgi:hypothetical protein
MGIPTDYNVAPNNDQEPCLLLRMRTDSMTMEWRVPGSAFYNNGTLRINEAIEYLPRTAGNEQATVVLRAVPARNVYWFVFDSTSHWGTGHTHCAEDYPAYDTRYLPPLAPLDTTGYELSLQYLGPGDIFVDAICFSDPQGYGFFVGDNNALPNFRRGALRDSVRVILANLGMSDARNNNLAFVELQEVMPHLGCLPSMNLMTRMIDEMTGFSDTIHTSHYGHPSGNIERLAVVDRLHPLAECARPAHCERRSCAGYPGYVRGAE